MTILHKTCTQCKVSKPLDEFPPDRRNADGKQAKCRVCRATNQRDYIRQYPDKKREADKRYRQEHAEQVQTRKKKWAQENREHTNQWYVEWRRKNPERSSANVRASRARHPESARVVRERYRSRRQGAEGNCTIAEWKAVLLRYAPDGRCLACGQSRPLTMDHVVPLSRGGANTPDNLQPLCRSCNTRKGRSIIDYRT